MKRVWKDIIGAVSASKLLRPWALREFKARVNVAYYHFVGPATPYYSAFYGGCTFDRFRSDIEQLAKVFQFASLEEVCQRRHSKRCAEGKPMLALTFDDGFRLNQAELLGLLESYGIKATTFVITGCVDNCDLMWRNKLSAILYLAGDRLAVSAFNSLQTEHGLERIKTPEELLHVSRRWNVREKDKLADELWCASALPPLHDFLAEYRPYFTWEELGAWQAAGHTIGLHTKTHPYCSQLDEQGVAEEIVLPAGELRKRFHLDKLPLSYPFGNRLLPERERALVEDGIVDYAFGIGGFAPRKKPSYSLERAGLEQDGVAWPVYGHTLTSSARRIIAA